MRDNNQHIGLYHPTFFLSLMRFTFIVRRLFALPVAATTVPCPLWHAWFLQGYLEIAFNKFWKKTTFWSSWIHWIVYWRHAKIRQNVFRKCMRLRYCTSTYDDEDIQKLSFLHNCQRETSKLHKKALLMLAISPWLRPQIHLKNFFKWSRSKEVHFIWFYKASYDASRW